MKGECLCRCLLLSRELTRASNISQCSRLTETSLDTRGLRYRASVPLWIGGRAAGVINLAGPEEGLFDEEMLRMLDGVGNQMAVALERAELHEGLERLVAERTARLTAEVEERKRIQEEQVRLVAILDATPDLVATASPDGQLFYCNQAGRRLLGLQHSDLDAFGIADGFSAWARRLLEEEGVPQPSSAASGAAKRRCAAATAAKPGVANHHRPRHHPAQAAGSANHAPQSDLYAGERHQYHHRASA